MFRPNLGQKWLLGEEVCCPVAVRIRQQFATHKLTLIGPKVMLTIGLFKLSFYRMDQIDTTCLRFHMFEKSLTREYMMYWNESMLVDRLSPGPIACVPDHLKREIQ